MHVLRYSLITLIASLLCGCSDDTGRGVLLTWKDGAKHVTLEDHGSFDMSLELHDRTGGRDHTNYVIDKSAYGTLRFIWYQDALWAANDQFLFARYDPKTETVTTYNELPFTLWEGQGKVLSKYSMSPGPASMRRDFPMVKEGNPPPSTTQSTTAH